MTDSSSPNRRRRRRRGGRGRNRNKQQQSHQQQGKQQDATPANPEQSTRRPDVDVTPLEELTGAFGLLSEPIRRAVASEGYRNPTPIQEQTIPVVAEGRDLIGCAQTGTGKTAAFTLPILQGLAQAGVRAEPGRPHCLVLAPTRELAAQIGECVQAYSKFLDLSHTVIFGGVGQNPQVRAMERGVDILVATPGRLIDLIDQGHVTLDRVAVYVLDEADRMLDMGFIPDIRRITAKLPKQRQNLFLSATMPPEVEKLAADMLHDPVRITIAPDKPAVERIDQCVLFVDNKDKQTLLTHIMSADAMDKVIIFTRTKHGANKVAKKLNQAGITAAPIHGNKSQGARTRALEEFRDGRTRALVATDIAARGIDVDGITHVINFNLPEVAETYVHRIGRTARAGTDGDAISLCAADERDYLRDIEKLLRHELPVLVEHDYHSETARRATGEAARPAKKSGGGGGGRRGGGGRGRSGGGGGGGRGRSGGGGNRGGGGGGGRSRGSSSSTPRSGSFGRRGR